MGGSNTRRPPPPPRPVMLHCFRGGGGVKLGINWAAVGGWRRVGKVVFCDGFAMLRLRAQELGCGWLGRAWRGNFSGWGQRLSAGS